MPRRPANFDLHQIAAERRYAYDWRVRRYGAHGTPAFYTQLRPLLVGHRAASDRRIFASILLLEDLVATKSATFCNHRTYVSRTIAEGMIGPLAAVHARFYGDRELATRDRGADKMSLQYYTQKAFDVVSHHVPEEVLARRRAVRPAAMSALASHESGPQGTAPL